MTTQMLPVVSPPRSASLSPPVTSSQLLLDALIQPGHTAALSLTHWNVLLRMARQTDLVARLGGEIRRTDAERNLPPRAREQLECAVAAVDRDQRRVVWEVDRVRGALESVGVRCVLLKGAAYILAEMPWARGRAIRDIDILVPGDRLAAAEAALGEHGWEPLEEDEYDDRYYREWMHELPPLRHRTRGTVLDVHHTILPLTGRVHPDPTLLLDAAREIPGTDLWTLAPHDMVLHAAAHLFQDGEVAGGLRDLVDLDRLWRWCSETDDQFGRKLVLRASQLTLQRPLYYALRYARQLLDTPLPPALLEQIPAPPEVSVRIMDALVPRALLPNEGGGGSWGNAGATVLLYLRAHWLRMPPRVLFRHLLYKLRRRWLVLGAP